MKNVQAFNHGHFKENHAMSMNEQQLADALNRLYKRHSTGIKFGLDGVNALLECMDHPEKCFAAVHVAGTNGKGSVCAMTESILRTAGYRTGLYSSPHIMEFNERIQVMGVPISDLELMELFEIMEGCSRYVSDKPDGCETTFFEFTTTLAFEYFRRKKCQFVVVETGMGGRLDATNTVMPVVSAITPISLEHMAYLGKDIPSIAREKSGIIKEGRPVVCGKLDGDAMSVVKSVAREKHSLLVESMEKVTVRRLKQDLAGQEVSIESTSNSYGKVRLPLVGKHQIENCAHVVAIVETIAEIACLDIPPEAVKAGLESVRWPGRFEVISRDPDMVLDVAHNPGAAKVLASTLKEVLKKRPVCLVVGMCNDKDEKGFLAEFTGLAKKCWAVPLQTERSTDASVIAGAGKALGLDIKVSTVKDALKEAKDWAVSENGVICVAGSFFLISEVLASVKTCSVSF